MQVLAELPATRRTVLDLQSLPAPLAALVRQLAAAGRWVEVTALPRTVGLATAVAYLYSESVPVLVAGSCTRHELTAAITGALTEAAQSRLALVTGTREDVPTASGPHRPPPGPPSPDTGAVSFSDLERRPPTSPARTPAQDVIDLSRGIAELTGHEPLVVDLSHATTGIEVRRVVAPGLDFDLRHNLPRPHRQTLRGSCS